MAKKKIYAVKTGKTRGIFFTWKECEESVKGYPGAEFKGFFSLEEARAYLGGDPLEKDKKEMEKREQGEGIAPFVEVPENGIVAYVDGSYDHSIGKYSFGCIILTSNGEVFRFSGNGDDPQSLAIRNVAGEMLGAMYALRWAIKKGVSSMILRYDYEGIEKWVTGAWKARNPLTQKYAAFMQRGLQAVQVTFEKVRAHTGDYYNEEADQLAKSALTETDGILPIS